MTALPPEDARNMRDANPRKTVPVRHMHTRWIALHDRADALTEMAQLATEPRAQTCDIFADLASNASDWQRNLAAEAIGDIEAMIEPGLAALALLAKRNLDPCAPALALWREFYSSREAVLAMLKRSSGNAQSLSS